MGDFDLELYNQLVDELLQKHLNNLAIGQLAAKIEDVDPAELPEQVGRLIGRWAHETLASTEPDDRAKTALQISTAVLGVIEQFEPDPEEKDRQLAAPIRRLSAIEQLAPTGEPVPIRRPPTPLRSTI